MEEFNQITKKYHPEYVHGGLSSLDNLNRFALIFFKDVAAIYDRLARLKNVERNPSGFTMDDAPILGLLVRIAKLLREVVGYYERDMADIISITFFKNSRSLTNFTNTNLEMSSNWCGKPAESRFPFTITRLRGRNIRSVHRRVQVHPTKRTESIVSITWPIATTPTTING